MFLQYPYTDLYNLNLDWMIKAIKEVQDTIGELGTVVNSVNGMTGDVQITKAFITGLLEHVTNTFNGRDGDVTLQNADVNGLNIDICYVSDPGEVITDFTQTELNEFWASGKRLLILLNNLGVPDRLYVLYMVGTTVTPQAFEPTGAQSGVYSVNGKTGLVTVTGEDIATSETDATTVAANIEDLQSDVSMAESEITTLQQNAGTMQSAITALQNKFPVAVVDGGTGSTTAADARTALGITGANVPSAAISGADDVDAGLSSLSGQIANVQNGLAYIVGDTNTTGSTLEIGTFVYVKGHSTIAEGLRTVTSSISADGSITTNNTAACTNGGLNALNAKITTETNGTGTIDTNYATENSLSYHRYGNLIFVSVTLHLKNIPAFSDTVIGSNFPPSIGNDYCISNIYTNDSNIQANLKVDSLGKMTITSRNFSVASTATTLTGQLIYSSRY